MTHSNRNEIIHRLVADYAFKHVGDKLSGGKCPACNAPEAYAYTDKLFSVFCPRASKCGVTTSIKTLYPDLFERYNERFKPTKSNPTATADAYMHTARGFDIAQIKGWYTQGKFGNISDTQKNHHNKQTATVRFALADGVYMERFVEAVEETSPETSAKVTRKQNFKGKWSGLAWFPPTLLPDQAGEDWIEDGSEVWITESIIDAITLNINGIKAIGSLNAQTYPEKALEKLKGKNITLVWAFDNDEGGTKHMPLHVNRSRKEGFNAVAAYIPTKEKVKDWNELHARGGFSDKVIAECRHHGELLLASSALEKAKLIFDHYNSRFFCVEFRKRTYGVSVTTKNDGDVIEINEIANFAFHFLYFTRNQDTDESKYTARIALPTRAKTTLREFTGAQMASAAEFKKRALSVAAGAVWTGNNGHLDWILQKHLPSIKIVETINYVGYSKDHDAYVFNEDAFWQNKRYKLNNEEFFDFGKTNIKSNLNLKITIGDAKSYDNSWLNDLWAAYGTKGFITLSYWIGSLFAEQIRDHQASLPFLEVVGLPGAGKTTIINFLWRLFGRNSGISLDPSKSTSPARLRKFAQLSNLPIMLIEAERNENASKFKQFDWDETKTLYDGEIASSRGVKNSGNETYDPPFRASLVIMQNDTVTASPAVMERIVHLEFTKDLFSAEGKQAADRLLALKTERLSYFLAICLQNASKLLEIYKKSFPIYEQKLMGLDEVRNLRIAKNHAQLMAMAQSVFGLIKLDNEKSQLVRDEIKKMAIERQQAIGGDHPVVEQFWEIVDYLESTKEGGGVVNHSRPDDKICINLNQFTKVAAEHRQDVPSIDHLKKHLRDSKSRKYLAYKNINSQIPRTNAYGEIETEKPWQVLKCFVFSNPRQNETAHD